MKRTFKHKKVPPRFISTRSFKNFNEEAYLNDLGDLDWSGVLNATNADVAADIFSSNVLKVLNKLAPCVKRRVKNSNPPWVNDHLLHSIRERDAGFPTVCLQIGGNQVSLRFWKIRFAMHYGLTRSSSIKW